MVAMTELVLFFREDQPAGRKPLLEIDLSFFQFCAQAFQRSLRC